MQWQWISQYVLGYYAANEEKQENEFRRRTEARTDGILWIGCSANDTSVDAPSGLPQTLFQSRTRSHFRLPQTRHMIGNP
jgi:hypothetical protein